jgi:hypothetical protein
MSPGPRPVKVRPMNDAIKHLAQAETGSQVHRRQTFSS